MATPSPGVAVGKAAMVLLVLAAVAVGAFFVLRDGRAPELPPTATPGAAAAPPESAAPARAATDRAPERLAATPAPAPGDPVQPASAGPEARTPPAAIVRGRVVDVRNAAVAGAEVAFVAATDKAGETIVLHVPRELRETTQGAVKTDERGEFALSLSQLGPFELIARHPEHPATRQAGEAATREVQGLLLVLRDGATITGRVVGAPAGAGEVFAVARQLDDAAAAAPRAPFAFDFGNLFDGLDLPVPGARTPVDADGSFRLTGLEPDARFRIEARTATAETGDRRCTERVEAAAGATGLELRWRPTVTLAVRVLDADRGAPLEDLDVTVGPIHTMSVFGTEVKVPMREPFPKHHFPGGLVELDDLGVTEPKHPLLGLEIRAAGHFLWSRDDIDATRPGRIDLGTASLGAAPIVRVHVADANGPVAGVPVTLERGDQGGGAEASQGTTLRTTTTVRRTDKGAAEAPPQPQRRPVTDSNGTIELTPDFRGDALLVATSPDHAVARSEPFALPERGIVERQLHLVRGGTVVVHALDGHGAPLAATNVQREGPGEHDEETRKTGADGTLTFAHVAPGSHTFRLAPEDRGGVVIRIGGQETTRSADEAKVDVADGATADVRLTAALLGDLRGTITLDGQPLSRADLRLLDGNDGGLDAAVGTALSALFGNLGGGPSTRTGRDGDYTLRGVRTGAHRLQVAHRDLAMPAHAELTITEGDNRFDLALVSTTVRGRVLDERGEPISGAIVSVEIAGNGPVPGVDAGEVTAALSEALGGAQPDGVRTDGDGAFELRGVHAGASLRLTARSRNHVPGSQRIDAVAAGTTRDGIELRLAPAGRLRVRSTAPGDDGATVRVEWAGGEPKAKGAATREQPLRDGKATFDGLSPGRWKVALTRDGAAAGTPRERTIDVQVGELATVDF